MNFILHLILHADIHVIFNLLNLQIETHFEDGIVAPPKSHVKQDFQDHSSLVV